MARPKLLFRKLLLVLSACMLSSVLLTGLYFRLAGLQPPPNDPLWKLGGTPIVPIVIAALVSIVFGIFLAWYLSRPLEHLRWGLQRMAQGELGTRVATRMHGRRDEIADLAHDIDGMAAQLQELLAARDRLLHDISHELRSPLFRIQAAIGLHKQGSTPVDTMVERVERETQRLESLIEEMLTLHRLGAAAAPLAREVVDVVELLHDIAADADFEARAMNRSVTIETPPAFIANVNGELVYRALENVIRNAVKHTAPDTAVTVRATCPDDGNRLQVVVSDCGPGVPPEMLTAIFEPFVRLDRADQVRGIGLGLAIAQRAFVAHGGSIRASLMAAGGLCMTIELPR